MCGWSTCTHCTTLSIFYADDVYCFHLTRWGNVSTTGGTEDNDCKRVKPFANAQHWPSLQGSSYHKQNSSTCHRGSSFSIVASICRPQIFHFFFHTLLQVSHSHSFFYTCLPLSHSEPLNNAALSYSGKVGLHTSLTRWINLQSGYINMIIMRTDMTHFCIFYSKACTVMRMKVQTLIWLLVCLGWFFFWCEKQATFKMPLEFDLSKMHSPTHFSVFGTFSCHPIIASHIKSQAHDL